MWLLKGKIVWTLWTVWCPVWDLECYLISCCFLLCFITGSDLAAHSGGWTTTLRIRDILYKFRIIGSKVYTLNLCLNKYLVTLSSMCKNVSCDVIFHFVVWAEISEYVKIMKITCAGDTKYDSGEEIEVKEIHDLLERNTQLLELDFSIFHPLLLLRSVINYSTVPSMCNTILIS